MIADYIILIAAWSLVGLLVTMGLWTVYRKKNPSHEHDWNVVKTGYLDLNFSKPQTNKTWYKKECTKCHKTEIITSP